MSIFFITLLHQMNTELNIHGLKPLSAEVLKIFETFWSTRAVRVSRFSKFSFINIYLSPALFISRTFLLLAIVFVIITPIMIAKDSESSKLSCKSTQLSGESIALTCESMELIRESKELTGVSMKLSYNSTLLTCESKKLSCESIVLIRKNKSLIHIHSPPNAICL